MIEFSAPEAWPELNWPLEYVAIENSRQAARLGFKAPWLQAQEQQPKQAGSPSEQQRAVEEARVDLLAAHLMRRIADDLSRCIASCYAEAEKSQLSSEALAEINECLQTVWREVIRPLAALARRPYSSRKLYAETLRLCRDQTMQGGSGFAPHPSQGTRPGLLSQVKTVPVWFGHAIWQAGYHLLCDCGRPAQAERLLLDCWDDYAEKQSKEPEAPIYRAHASYFLAEHYLGRGESASAARWALLTFIHDIDLGHFRSEEDVTWDATGMCGFLNAHFGLTEGRLRQLFSAIWAFAQPANKRAAIETKPLPWSTPLLRFPEYTLSRLLSRARPQSVLDYFPPELRSLGGTRTQHPVSKWVMKAFKDQQAKASEQKRKGDWLEELMTYLFSTLEGAQVRTKFFRRSQSSEVDLVVDFLAPPNHWLPRQFGQRLAVECKHWDTSVTAEVVQQLVGKMSDHDCAKGLIVSTKQFTEPAIDFARQRGQAGGVLFLDGTALLEMSEPDFLSALLVQCEKQWDRGDYTDVGQKTPAFPAQAPLADRFRAVEEELRRSPEPVTAIDLASRLSLAKPADVAEILEILETLVTLGRARRQGDKFTP